MKSNIILFTRKSNKILDYPSNFNISPYPSDIRSTHLENPIFANIEYANGLMMLFGDKEEEKAVKLYEKVTKMKGQDAMEMLDIEMAKNELED